jgi:hypothetical protein
VIGYNISRSRQFAGVLVVTLSMGLASCQASEGAAKSEPAAASMSGAAAPAAQVTADFAHWQHPTKAVFTKYGVTLRKVTITDGLASFEVEFPFDPQTSPNAKKLSALCVELLTANGKRPYALIAPDDQVEFNVSWQREGQKIVIENRAYVAAKPPQ